MRLKQKTQEANNDSQVSDSAHIVATAVLVSCIVGLAFIYVVGAYLQRSSIENLLSFYGADGVPPYDGVSLPKPWGVHYFGDFMLPLWQSNMKDPWLYTSFDGPPVNNYLPFTMAVFWVFGRLSYWRAFALFQVVSVALFIAPLWMSLKRFTRLDRVEIVGSTILLTAPFISLLDRGNSQLMLLGICGLALVLLIDGRPTLGAVFLGVAIALKGYPVILLLLWLARRRLKDCAASLTLAGVLTLVPMTLYGGNIWDNSMKVLGNVQSWGQYYSDNYPAYNQSLKGSLKSLTLLSDGPLANISQFLLSHFTFVLLIIVLVGIYLCLQKTTVVFEQVLICCSIIVVSVDYVAPYAIGVFFIACVALWAVEPTLPARWITCHAVLLGLLLAPKGFPVTFWRDNFDYKIPTYGSLLAGFIVVGIIGLVAARRLILIRTSLNTRN